MRNKMLITRTANLFQIGLTNERLKIMLKNARMQSVFLVAAVLLFGTAVFFADASDGLRSRPQLAFPSLGFAVAGGLAFLASAVAKRDVGRSNIQGTTMKAVLTLLLVLAVLGCSRGSPIYRVAPEGSCGWKSTNLMMASTPRRRSM